MAASGVDDPFPSRLRCGIVLGGDEDSGRVLSDSRIVSVRYASMFPSPRTERVSPGHLVAVASAPARPDAVVWRWYDAVVLGDEPDGVRLWEPAHGEVVATRRRPQRTPEPGTRAYLSAGLPGAPWWVAGAVVARPEDADVELDEVRDFFTGHGLWNAVFDV